MPRLHNRLNPRLVATLAEKGYHADGGGLYLKIDASKRWVFRFTRAGKPREMGLGPVHTVSLAEARQAAREARQDMLAGADPIEKRAAQRAAQAAVQTFEKAAAAYIAEHKNGWRNAKHAEQWTSTLAAYAEPVIGAKPWDHVTTDDVLRILKPIWSTKTETATRVRQRIEAVLGAEIARSRRDLPNPARWRGHLDKLLPKPSSVSPVQHFPALHYSKLPDFMEDLREEQGTAARSLEFVILTAARSGMVLGATAAEIAGDVWTVPSARMKTKRAHEIPLSKAAKALVTVDTGLLFPHPISGNPLSENAMLALLERMKRTDITVHGFRSTFKGWADELGDFPDDLSEIALAHVIKDKSKAAYKREAQVEKRRTMMEAWAAYCGY